MILWTRAAGSFGEGVTGWNADAAAHRRSDACRLTVVSSAQASRNLGKVGAAPHLAVLRGGCAALTGFGGHTSRCLICIGGVSGEFAGAVVMAH